MTGMTTVADFFADWDVPGRLSLEFNLAPMIYLRGRSRIRRTHPAPGCSRKAV